MGYTNYWRQKTDIPQGKWKKIKEEYEEYVKQVAGDLIEVDGDDANFVWSDNSGGSAHSSVLNSSSTDWLNETWVDGMSGIETATLSS